MIDQLLAKINTWQDKPELFTPGEPRFWDDPHISQSMLEAHLDSSHEAASRQPQVIEQTVQHWLSSGLVKPGDRLLDLGCGPGLYAQRLSQAGVHVTGVDLSENSLRYAKAQAQERRLEIDYRMMNFLDLDEVATYDVVIQVFGELNTFSDLVRDKLFSIIGRALKPEGLFIFDLSTPHFRYTQKPGSSWYVENSGFWRPHRHLVLEQAFNYPENDVWLDQYIIADHEDVKVYRNWFHDYQLDTIQPVLETQGFTLRHVWNDLAGSTYTKDGDWLGLVIGKDRHACLDHE